MAQIDRINGLVGSIAVKAPCKVATTANITLSGTQTIDGVAVVADDRVLVKDQTTASENGIYDVSAGAWSRSPDWNGARDVVQGTQVVVAQGTGADTYDVDTANPITIGTTSVTISSFVSGEATAAAASAAAASASEIAAAASAATINLPSITGKALNILRANAGETAHEYRTPAQVLADISAAGTATANTFAATQTFSKGADIASATALTLGADGNYFDVTGVTTITSIATVGIGTVIKLHFDGILTLTHHATDLILPSGANITTAAGDEAEFIEYAAGDFRCTSYTKASGEAVVGGGLQSTQVFTANGTWTKPAGITKVIVEVQAGGGGGGGSGASTGASGGGGGYTRELIDVSGTASETVTVGAGGPAGTSGGGTGGTGGTSSFGAYCSATGGTGGVGNTTTVVTSGGTGSGGDVNINGGHGHTISATMGIGGSSQLGRSRATALTAEKAGEAGLTYGGGATGGRYNGGTQRAGGAGSAGIVIVWEYK